MNGYNCSTIKKCKWDRQCGSCDLCFDSRWQSFWFWINSITLISKYLKIIYFVVEKRTYKYALVLFDYDGFTAVVETKRLEDYDGELERSQMCTIHYECKLQSVEILDLSGRSFWYVFKSAHAHAHIVL